jgi:tetratricopeptide (TPR) repeat protein
MRLKLRLLAALIGASGVTIFPGELGVGSRVSAALGQAGVPSESPHPYETASIAYREGRYADALRGFDQAARLAGGAEAELAVRARKGSVRAALRIAEFDRAHGDARALAAERGSDPEAQALRGDAEWAMGLFDEAQAAYERAAALDPGAARARFGIARSLASRSQLRRALEETRLALAAAPDDPEAHALAGSIHERLLQFEEGAAAYAAYADLLPAAEAAAIATARTRAEFLRSFAGRPPLDMTPGDAAAVHTIPFKLVRNKVVIQGRLNGAHVEWVLDTGAERTGISFDLAYRARIRTVTSTLTAGVGRASLRRVQLGRADRLEIGTLRMTNVPVSIRDPAGDGAPRWQGESLSPLPLGLSVVVDYQRRHVTLARELPNEPVDVTLPLRVHRLPMVRGMLNAEHPAYFIVDTGGEVISISAETARALGMQPARRIPLRVYGLSGLDETAFLLPGVDLDFNEIEHRKVGVAVLNLRAPSVLLGFQVGGIVGHKFLGDYRVAIDFSRGELRLSK